MSTDRRRTVEDLFARAIELAPEARDRFLDEACGGDVALRVEVESLLHADSNRGGFLAAPADPAVLERPDPLIGRSVGAWRIVERIGRGGMGAVYLAERADASYEGRAAIKVARRGMETPELLRRFHHERRLLARLQHPHIARLLDGGALEDGLPYFVMEYVAGVPLDRHCDERDLALEARLELFLAICDAVQYAHQQLIVHRDLKPSNILVTEDGTPRLLDFGIAKALGADFEDSEAMTREGERPRTPRYASPEQIRGERVTVATDVYSLGVLLHELLAGEAPFVAPGTTPAAFERLVLEQDPPPPSLSAAGRDTPLARREGGPRRLARRLEGDLDAIVLTALRKDPERRYRAVSALADDLRRHRDGLPVGARRGSLRYRSARFVRRHALALGAAAAVFVALAAGAVTSTALYLRARAARLEAEREREVATEVSRFLESLFAGADPHRAQGRDVTVLRELMADASRRLDTEVPAGSAVAGALHLSIGESYRHLAEFEEAERHLAGAVATFDGSGGQASGYRVRAHHALGSLFYDTNRFDRAETELGRALALADSAGAAAGEARGEILTSLGLLDEARGRYAEAESRYRQAIEDARAHGGPGHPAVGRRLSDLAVLVMNQRRLDEADSLLDAAISTWRGATAPFDSIELATALHNKGGVLRRRKAYAEAEPFYREALGIHRRLRGDDHPGVAVTLNNLGSLMESMQRFTEAEPFYREALRIQRAALGERHRDVGTTLNNLAGLLRKSGRLAESAPLFESALATYRAALGADHPWVAIVLTNYAHLLEASGRWARMREVVAEAEAVSRRHFAAGHWRTAVIASLRGSLLAHEGRAHEAEPLLAASFRTLADSLGDSDPHTVEAARRLRAVRGPS